MAKHFGIIAATFSGNRGAEAMLLSTVEHLRAKDGDCVIHVLSYAPTADLAELALRPIKNVFIHSSTPQTLVLKWFALALLLKVFPFFKKQLSLSHRQSIRSLLNLDAVFCLAGVSFIDGREKFLPFNVLTLFPFLINGVPVFKMAQAVGPIRSFLNVLCARWTLPRLKYFFARGHITAELLESAKILPQDKWKVSPDIAFGLSYPKLEASLADVASDIAIVPSVILDRKHEGYRDLIVNLVLELQSKGIKCSFVVHSWKSHTSKPFNNDLPLVRDLAARLAQKNCEVAVWGESKNACEIKSLIAAHRLCLTSRFHGMIASLDAAVPTLVIGWSHKYREILAMFGREEWALRYEGLTAQSCAAAIQSLLLNADSEKQMLGKKALELRQQVDAAFEDVWRVLQS
jgi:colanic acid/amylovoran biosynthesis protein